MMAQTKLEYLNYSFNFYFVACALGVGVAFGMPINAQPCEVSMGIFILEVSKERFQKSITKIHIRKL